MTEQMKNTVKKLLWDYNFTEEEFIDILEGKRIISGFDRKWAVRRAIEGLNYYELMRIAGFKTVADVWPEIRDTFRVKSIKEGMDYVLRKNSVSHPG